LADFIKSQFELGLPLFLNILPQWAVFTHCISVSRALYKFNDPQLGDGGHLEHLPSSLLQSLKKYEYLSLNETVRCIQGDV
jgi:hypothetical protein